MLPAPHNWASSRRVFLDRKEWWRLVPDESILAAGGNTSGKILNLAARHQDGQWLMVYLGGKSSFSVSMQKIANKSAVNAFWIDPRNGDRSSIGRFANTGDQPFSTPPGWEDALLVLETVPGN